MKENQRKLGRYLCKKWYSLAIFTMVLMGASFCMFDVGTSALTTVPTKTNFQGRLTNSSGNIMPDGLYNMKFRLFTVDTGGAAVWTETRETTNRVQVTNGLFSVKLGDVTPIPASLFASGGLFFEVELPTPGTATCSTAACASFTEGPMTPRNQLATSAYAYNSETLDGLDSSNFVQLGQGVQTDASTASSIFINKTASGNLLQLQSSGTDVYTISNTGVVTTGTWQGSTVGVQYGGTGLTGYATGDLLYASGATTLGKLAAVASGSCLTSQGVGTAPGWGSCGLSAEADTLATVTARGATTSTNTSFNGTLTATSDVNFTLAGTENLAISSDLAGTVNVLQVVGTPSATAGTTRGILVQQADSANANGIDSGLLVNNADTDLVITNAIQIANSGGGGYTNLINAPSFVVNGSGVITQGTWNGTALTDANVSNTLTASILQGSGSATDAVDLGTAEVAGTLGVANGGTGATSLNDLITLGSHTIGNYVANNTAGTGIAITGSAGEGWSPTISLDYSATLAGNPALAANQSTFASTGLIFEGSTANTFELLLTSADPNADAGGDVTLTLPAVTGTVISTGNISDIAGLIDSQVSDTLTASILIGSGSITNAVDLGSAEVAGILSGANGGTGQSSYAIGDMLYASGATTLSKLAAGAANSCLTSQGAGTAPAWADCEDDTLAAVTGRGGSTSSNLVFNGTLGVTSDTTFTFAGTENLVINSDLNAGVNLLQITGTPSATAGTTRGILVQQADSANTNGLDTGVYINNADTDLAITNAIHINNTGGGGFTNLINATTFTVTGAGNITNGTWNGSAVGVQYGGTGATTFTSGGLLYGNGTGAIQATAAGGTSQCLTGGSTPTWGTCNLQTAYDRSIGETTPEIKLDSTRRGLDIQDADSTINDDLLTVRTGAVSGLGTSMFSIASNGAVTTQNITDSTAAFTINRAGTTGSLFVADTSNARVQIGSTTTDSTGVVLVLDTKDNAGDPTGVDGAMYYNSSMRSYRCYKSGSWKSCGPLAFANIAASNAVVNTTTETNFNQTYTIPAGDCQPGKVYRVTARGLYGTQNWGVGTASNLTIRVKLGSTVIGSTGVVAPGANRTNRQWTLDFNITCINTTSVEGQGAFQLFTTAATVTPAEMSNTGNITGLTLSSAQTLQLSAQWTFAYANSTVTLRQLVVEELGS